MAIKTVSLETAKALKEAGFGQDSEKFYYPIYEYELKKVMEPYERAVNVPTGKILRWELANGYDEAYFDYQGKDRMSAPTSDELLEELPAMIKISDEPLKYWVLQIEKSNHDFWCGYVLKDKLLQYFNGNNLPEALAAMWLWLKKENQLAEIGGGL